MITMQKLLITPGLLIWCCHSLSVCGFLSVPIISSLQMFVLNNSSSCMVKKNHVHIFRSPEVAICIQFLSLLCLCESSSSHQIEQRKRDRFVVHVSRANYKVELMFCWFMWMCKTLGEHIWWRLKMHWEKRNIGLNVNLDVLISRKNCTHINQRMEHYMFITF